MTHTKEDDFQKLIEEVFTEPLPAITDDLIETMKEGSLSFNVLYNIIGIRRAILASILAGGRLIYIPQCVPLNSPTVKIFGKNGIKRISNFYAGEEYKIPIRIGKFFQIYCAYLYGISQTRISASIRISHSAVTKAIKDIEANKGIFSNGYFYPIAPSEREIKIYAEKLTRILDQ